MWRIVLTTIAVAVAISGGRIAQGQVTIQGVVRNLKLDSITTEVPGIKVNVFARIQNAARTAVLFSDAGSFSAGGGYKVEIAKATIDRFGPENMQIDILFRHPDRLPADLLALTLKNQTIDVAMPKAPASVTCCECRRCRLFRRR